MNQNYLQCTCQVTVAVVETIKVLLTFVCGVANANVVVTIALTFNFK